MKKEGECEWYQSMGHIFLYISAIFLLFFKGPRPFKYQKTLFSGLTTQNSPTLNQGTSAAEKHDSGWVLAWIFLDSGSNIFRSRIICMLFYFQFLWIFDGGRAGGNMNCVGNFRYISQINPRNTVHSSICGFLIF
jgi:hypothetical protein